MSHHQIVIVGGGTAGITVAARLRNADPSLDIAIIEPSEKHYYQPLWTLVGGGMFKPEESGRDEVDLRKSRDALVAGDFGARTWAQEASVAWRTQIACGCRRARAAGWATTG